LVEIILQNLERGKTILVVSPSNVAIDTIAERLLKYIDEDSDQVCRIGHPTRLLEEVKRISVDETLGRTPNVKNLIEKITNSTSKSDKKGLINKLKTIRREEIFNLFEKCNVFMATTVSSGSRDLQDFLKEKKTYFDLIIIDECAQAKESECFIPILQGKK
jgi:ATP-dependent RNA/DNA helicase IGHMBP2